MPKQVLPVEELSKDARAVFKSVNREESDLACALILTAFLEQGLGSLLANRFVESSVPEKLLQPGRGILGTLQSRIDVAYTLGLITKGMFTNLCKVAEIRNVFAHSHIDVKFEDPRIQPQCEELELPELEISPDEGETPEQSEADFRALISTPRMRFTVVSALMANRLLLTARSTEHLPRKVRGWEAEDPAA